MNATVQTDPEDPLPSQGGSSPGVDRKHAQDEVKRLSQWLLRTQRISKVGGWVFNLRTGEVWVSPEACRIYGASEQELITIARVQSFPLQSYRPMLDQALNELVARRKPYDVEFQITRRADGTIVDIHSLAEYNPDDETVLGVIEDITERKQTEQALRDSQEKYQRLIETTQTGYVIVDGQGRVLDANQEYIRLTGRHRPEDVLGHSVLEWTAPHDRERNGAEISRCIEQGWVRNLEIDYAAPSGQLTPIEINATVLGSGASLQILCLSRDITERKRQEEVREKLQAQLTQAQKMESVGRLAGGVAHDFNNMLQAILGNVALALGDLPPDHPLRENLEEIQKSANRSADLTRQLLAFARKATIQPKLLDLNQTVAAMLKMLRRLIGENIDLSWAPGSSLWPVKVDPSQVDQLLANLCVNARDAITSTGKVIIESANVTLDDTYARAHPECVAGDYVMVVVSDTGQGMDETTRAHLFEPFFTTKEVGKGTGLGLATVFGIVKQNRGLINVYSEPGMGTTFKIYLPRALEPLVAAEQAAVHGSLQGTETVLLVEDEEQILSLGERILRQHGYRVLTAASPEAALTLAAQFAGPIHLLITDVVMPGMNGKELREHIRATHSDAKCLFMSGYTSEVIALHGVLDDNIHFLQKPFTIRTLAEMVRKVLEQA
jgi:two-component system, cell cycle sensor histidine kinase and response regulator CckA